MLNSFNFSGRLVADPELRYTPSNVPVASFRVACDRNFKNAVGETDTDFFNVTAWRSTAEFVCKYFSKGQEICIEGSMQQRQYEKDGVKRSTYEVSANQVHFCGSKRENDTMPAVNPAPAEFMPDFGAPPPVFTEDDDLPFN